MVTLSEPPESELPESESESPEPDSVDPEPDSVDPEPESVPPESSPPVQPASAPSAPTLAVTAADCMKFRLDGVVSSTSSDRSALSRLSVSLCDIVIPSSYTMYLNFSSKSRRRGGNGRFSGPRRPGPSAHRRGSAPETLAPAAGG